MKSLDYLKRKISVVNPITSDEELEEKVSYLLGKFFVKKVYLERDRRAYVNPTPMKNIGLANGPALQPAVKIRYEI